MRSESHQLNDEQWNMRLLGHCDLGGMGDGMHVALKGAYAFCGHMADGGTSIVDIRDPDDPRLVGRIPAPANTHSHKVEIVGNTMLVNRERLPDRLGGDYSRSWTAGVSFYDVEDPAKPREIGFWSSGGIGVHRMTYWEEPYAYVTAGASDFSEQLLVILDCSDPSKPVEVGRWWYPGMYRSEPRTWGADRIVKLHHALPRGNRLYAGMWDLGVVILDISDPTAPELVSYLDTDRVDGPARNTHTACPIPGRELLVTTDECLMPKCAEGAFHARLVDISDEKNPKIVSRLPVPQGDFCERGGRFGPHNVAEPRPGTLQSERLVHVTWFNAGIRVFDVSDPVVPREVGYHIPTAPAGQPAIQLNDLIVDADGLIYVTDRVNGGLYIFELDAKA
jgi:hypothetical protein